MPISRRQYKQKLKRCQLALTWLAGALLCVCISWIPTASAQDNLPFLQEQNGDYLAAIKGYQALISEIAADQGDFSRALIEPLMGLSRSLMATGDYDAAEQTVRRAQHLYHRNDGVSAIGQVGAIKLLVQYYLRTGQPALADQQQQFAYYLATRQGYSSNELLSASYELADWYKETGQYRAARRTLEDIIEQYVPQNRTVDSDNDDRAYPALLAAYTRLATITRLDGACCSHKKLNNAAQLLETREGLSSQQKIELNLALGDAHLLSGNDEQAIAYYRNAWYLSEDAQTNTFDAPREIAQAGVLAKRDPTHEVWIPRTERSMFASNTSRNGAFSNQFRQASFEERLSLAGQPPQSFTLPLNNKDYQVNIREAYTDSQEDKVQSMIGAPFQFNYQQLIHMLPNRLQSPEDLAAIRIEMEFTVAADGNLVDINILDDELPANLRTMMRTVLAKSKFRPRLVNGEPAATERVKMTQTFKPSV